MIVNKNINTAIHKGYFLNIQQTLYFRKILELQKNWKNVAECPHIPHTQVLQYICHN